MNYAIALFRAGCLLALLFPCAGLALSAPPSRHTPPFRPSGMAALSGDNLLIWDDEGNVQLFAGSAWKASTRFALKKPVAIFPCSSGFAALGAPETPSASTPIVLFDSHFAKRIAGRYRTFANYPSWLIACGQSHLPTK